MSEKENLCKDKAFSRMGGGGARKKRTFTRRALAKYRAQGGKEGKPGGRPTQKGGEEREVQTRVKNCSTRRGETGLTNV